MESLRKINNKQKLPKIMKEFKVNDYLTLKLEKGQTNIYVGGRLFGQCKFLLLNIPVDEISLFDDIQSIDDAAERLGWTENGQQGADKYYIPAETEFWGHCSNIQAWVENDYDTSILHSNLSFPLLEVLKNSGDPVAIKVFKEEVVKRLKNPSSSVINYFLEMGLFNQFNNEEMELLLEESPEIIKNLYQYAHPESIKYIFTNLKEKFPIVFLRFAEKHLEKLIEREELDELSYFYYDINLTDVLKQMIKNPRLDIVRFILNEYDSQSEFPWNFFEDAKKYAKVELKEAIIKLIMEGEFRLFWFLRELRLLDLLHDNDIKRLIYEITPSLLDVLLDGDIKFNDYDAIEYFYKKREIFLEKSLKKAIFETLKEGKLKNLINLIIFQWIVGFEKEELSSIISDTKIQFYDKLGYFFNELPNEYFIGYNEQERVTQALQYFCNLFHKILEIDKHPFIVFFRKLHPQIKQFIIEFLQNFGDEGDYLTDKKIAGNILAELSEENYLEGTRYVKYEGNFYFLEENTLKMWNKGIESIKKIKGIENYRQLRLLNLGNNPIKKIEGIEKLTNLRILSFQRCQIEEITGLDSLENLEQLNLVDNNIKVIKGFENLRNLRKLNLENNFITEIIGIEMLENLEELNLQNNSITEITRLNTLENLESLNLSNAWIGRRSHHNKIKKLYGLQGLYNLRILNLGNSQYSPTDPSRVQIQDLNQISEIEGLEDLTNLEELILKNNNISRMHNLNHLKNLKQLNLQGNNITEISGLEGNLKNLTSLNLSHNQISEIENLENLTNLKYLLLDNNKISKLKNLKKLPNIERISILAGNNLPKPASSDLRGWNAAEYCKGENIVPIQEVELRGKRYEVILGTLFLRDKSIRDISEIKGLRDIKGLMILDLSNNHITRIKNLESFKNLRRLDLSWNKIGKIEGLKFLNNLESLNLFRNNIRKIEGLGNLTNLKSLWLPDNKISKIEGLEKLVNLESIHLGSNNISVIEGLESLCNLRALHLDSNKINKIQGLEHLYNLEELSLGQNEIKKIEGLENLTELKSLSIYRNQITEIQGIAHLKKLKTFSPGLRSEHKVPFKSYGSSGRRYVGYSLQKIGVDKEKGIIKCPNKNCEFYIYQEWETCPNCYTKIKELP